MKNKEYLNIAGSDCIITIGEKFIKEIDKTKNEVKSTISSVVIYRKVYDNNGQFSEIVPIYLNSDDVRLLADKLNEIESRDSHIQENDDLPF